MRLCLKLLSSKCALITLLTISLAYNISLMKFNPEFDETYEVKTILVWTKFCNGSCAPFDLFKNGKLQTPPNCPYQNCYVTKINKYFNETNPLRYDAILFHGTSIKDVNSTDLPQQRDPKQNYIFVQLEAADRYPVCQPFFDYFFNWTMTYKLFSVIPWTFFKVKNLKKETVAPRPSVKWLKDMLPVSSQFKKQLQSKSLLAAAIVSDYHDPISRDLIRIINRELIRRYNQTIDIFDPVGTFHYHGNQSIKFYKMLQKDYFFYFAVESSLARDYVTEQTIVALNNNVVPIVWGMTDYERFLPPGSYISARDHISTTLVSLMLHLVSNLTAYSEYFRWRNHYTLHDSSRHVSPACKLCTMLNEEDGISEVEDFRQWWTSGFLGQCGPKLMYT